MLTESQIVARLVLGGLLSGAIGFEREFHGRAAGFRTHILLCIGSVLIMLTSIHMFDAYSGVVACDPGRIAAGVVTGIGFLGAGAIMRSKASIRGLTTAASLWVVSGIGLAVGSGLYSASIITTIITLVTLLFFSRLEHLLIRKDWYRLLVVETTMDMVNLARIKEVFEAHEAEVKDFDIERSPDGSSMIVQLTVRLANSKSDDAVISDVSRLSGIVRVRWQPK